MPETFDLENQPPDPHKPISRPPQQGLPNGPNRPVAPRPPLAGQLPTVKASDLLKTSGGRSGGSDSGGPDSPLDRRATPFDDFASAAFTFSIVLFFVGLGYLLWGMCSGGFADPTWHKVLGHASRERLLVNIGYCQEAMWIALLVATISFLFLYYHEDYAGFLLLGFAVILMIGIPYGVKTLFSFTRFRDTSTTTDIYTVLGNQAWLVGIPGAILGILTIVKNFIEGLENAKSRRSSLKFGKAATRDIKPRNQFLGACWNMPYCKEGVRAKCPIFLGKKGPCWRNKRGCMCDQTILLIAQAPNWKQNVAATVNKLEGQRSNLAMPELPPQPQLSREAKNERCRQCVIYNLHQEQKYKFLVALTLAASLAALYVFQGSLLSYTGDIFNWANNTIGTFSISKNAAPLFPNGAPVVVEWLMLGSVVLILMTNVLRAVEFVCFKLKI